MNYRNRSINFTCFECGKGIAKSYVGRDDEGVPTGAKDCVKIADGRYLCLSCKEIINARNREASAQRKKGTAEHWANIGNLDFGESSET